MKQAETRLPFGAFQGLFRYAARHDPSPLLFGGILALPPLLYPTSYHHTPPLMAPATDMPSSDAQLRNAQPQLSVSSLAISKILPGSACVGPGLEA
jgi:hypothetical protein